MSFKLSSRLKRLEQVYYFTGAAALVPPAGGVVLESAGLQPTMNASAAINAKLNNVFISVVVSLFSQSVLPICTRREQSLTSSIQQKQVLLPNPSRLFDTLPGQENILVGGNLLTVLRLPSGKIAERKKEPALGGAIWLEN